MGMGMGMGIGMGIEDGVWGMGYVAVPALAEVVLRGEPSIS